MKFSIFVAFVSVSFSYPIIIVGNKVDREYLREVSKEEGQKLAEENNVLFL